MNRKVATGFPKDEFRVIDMSTMMDDWDQWEKRFGTLFLKGRP